MKKQINLIAVTLLLSMTAFTVNAQNAFKKSDKFVEGTVSYTKSAGADATYSFNPTVGYFTSDKVAIGLNAGFGKDDAGVKNTNIGAFARCYILNIGNNLKTYSQLNVGNSTIDDAGTKSSAFGIDLGLGVNYFVSPRLALSLHVADLVRYTSVESNNSFSIGWNGVVNPLNASSFGLLYRF